MRILLIEDSDDHAQLVRQALAGHSLVHATTLHGALRREDLSGFDVALTDLTLPDARGLEAVDALCEQAPDVPLIVLTSVAEDQAAQLALEQGAQDYLVKEEFLVHSALAASMLKRTMRYAILRHEALRENRRLVRDLQTNKAHLERKNDRLRVLYDTAQRVVENVSHDFRTPLTVIKEYSSLIRDGIVGEVTADQRRMLHVVEDRADDLNTMVDDLLDLSKFEAGLLNVWRRNASVTQIAAHVMHGLERKAEVRGVKLSSTIGDDLPAVFCDEEKVGRVIVNLVVNAIKFCDEAGEIELWARADNEQRQIIVGVTDTGPGIPADKLKLIFERFRQAPCHTQQRTKGFGLGLSIARELTDLNLGRLDVHSVEGGGSTFTFTVPYAEASEVFLRYIRRICSLERGCPVCSMISLLAGSSSPRDLDDLDIFLSHNVCRDDLVLRVAKGRWLVMLLVPPVEVDKFVDRLRHELAEFSRNRPFGPLPEIDFRDEGVLTLTDSLADLERQVAPLIEAEEPCYA